MNALSHWWRIKRVVGLTISKPEYRRGTYVFAGITKINWQHGTLIVSAPLWKLMIGRGA